MLNSGRSGNETSREEHVGPSVQCGCLVHVQGVTPANAAPVTDGHCQAAQQLSVQRFASNAQQRLWARRQRL